MKICDECLLKLFNRPPDEFQVDDDCEYCHNTNRLTNDIPLSNLVVVNCLHIDCPTCKSKIDIYPTKGTVFLKTN